MKKKILLAFVLVLLSTVVLVWFIRPAVAQETIYIRADGSIEGTTNISTVDNFTYTFTDNIFNQSIVVERDNIVVDGEGYTLQGMGAEDSRGIDISGRKGVTIKSVEIRNFTQGIWLDGSSNNTILGNSITANKRAGIEIYSSNNTIVGNNITNNGVGILGTASNNTISGNNITNNSDRGIYLQSSLNNSISGNNIAANSRDGIFLFYYSNSNSISGNNITNNGYGILGGSGIYLYESSNNSIGGNNITNNKYGIYLHSSLDNFVYHNNFINNTEHVHDESWDYPWIPPSINVWDDGAGKGNYWSDYIDRYPDAEEIDDSGIWDTPYVIDENNQDNYPLMGEVPEEEVPEEVVIGVKAGDWIKYDYKVTGAPSGTVLPTWMKVEILSVEGTNVTVRLTMHMSNGTEGSETLTLDVARTLPYTCGTFDTLFGFGFVIPANSTVEGDYIYIMLLSPAFMLGTQIDGETTGTYAGASRTVVYATFSYIGDRYGNKPLKYYWDKQTGIMVEAFATLDGMTATAKATETNMWEAVSSPFWMQWWLWTIVVIVIVALVGAVYFLKKRKPPTPTAPPQGTELQQVS